MRRICIYIAICALSLCFSVSVSYAEKKQEFIEIKSEVASVVPNQELFIIKAGKNDGVGVKDCVLVNRHGEEIATSYIKAVSSDSSVAEVLDIESGKEIRGGDDVLIIKIIERDTEKAITSEQLKTTSQLQDELESLQAANEKLLSELLANKEKLDQEVDAAGKGIKETQTQLNKEIDALEENKAAIEKQIALLEKERERLEARLKEEKRKKDGRNLEMESQLYIEINALKDKIDILKAKLDELTKNGGEI